MKQQVSTLDKEFTKDVRIVRRYKEGSRKASYLMRIENFDPLQKLIENYRRIEKELEYQENVRDGRIVPLTATGKVRSYNAEHHYGLFDKLNKIGSDLLRYKYGRVPENEGTTGEGATPLIVNLSKNGETFTINENKTELQEEDISDEINDHYEE